MERTLITYPTWERYSVLSHVVSTMAVRDRRKLFNIIRKLPQHENVFFPSFGLSLNEFAVFHVINENKTR